MSEGDQEEGLLDRLVNIAGQLQKLRSEAMGQGSDRLSDDIAEVIDSLAWAAGIYVPGQNVMDPPADCDPGNLVCATRETDHITDSGLDPLVSTPRPRERTGFADLNTVNMKSEELYLRRRGEELAQSASPKSRR